MNLLLDTHVALWAITDSPKLSKKAREIPVSSQDAGRFFRESGYRFLPVEAEHAMAIEGLPAHHEDPFDRILVAQALVEPMRLMTHDPMVARYSDTIIEV